MVSYFFHSKILASITASQISLGRGLRRSVAMFFSARDLVEENDRRLIAIAADEEVKSTLELVLYFLSALLILIYTQAGRYAAILWHTDYAHSPGKDPGRKW